MKKYQESTIIYNKIKESSNLTDDAMLILGVTRDKIDIGMKQCISKGMSRKKAAQHIYNIWKKASPDAQAAPATPKEMELMGFKIEGEQWIHSSTSYTISKEQASTVPFSSIEREVLNRTKLNASESPS
jgi:hypothetical protein